MTEAVRQRVAAASHEHHAGTQNAGRADALSRFLCTRRAFRFPDFFPIEAMSRTGLAQPSPRMPPIVVNFAQKLRN